MFNLSDGWSLRLEYLSSLSVKYKVFKKCRHEIKIFNVFYLKSTSLSVYILILFYQSSIRFIYLYFIKLT